MFIFVPIFNNKDKIMTKIFIFSHFGLNIHHTFYILLPWKSEYDIFAISPPPPPWLLE